MQEEVAIQGTVRWAQWTARAVKAMSRGVRAPELKWRSRTSTSYIQVAVLHAKTDLFSRALFSFCPLCWPPLFLPFSRHLCALFSASKSALFCRAKGTAQSLERGSLRMDLSTKFGKEIPSRNLRKKRSEDP